MSARAAPSRLFDVARAPLPHALIEFARQAGVSLGGDVASCGRGETGLTGRYSTPAALDRLLRGAPCGYVMLDPATVLIRRAPAPAPIAPPPRKPDAPASIVVVTASRRPEALERSALSVTALDHQELRQSRSHDLSDISVDVVGLTVTNLGTGRDKLLLRGLSDGVFTGATQSNVALYLDDLPITYNAPDPALRLTDIERVEIVRGPQGALYGGGAIGGVVRLLQRQPSTEAFSGSASLEAAGTQRGGESGAGDLMVNIPLLDHRAAVRLVGYSESGGGYIDNPALGLKDVNRTRRVGARLTGVLDLSPVWRLKLGAIDQSVTSTDAQYAIETASPLSRNNRVREPYQNDFDELTASLQGGLGWGELKASVGLIHHQTDTRFDASADAAVFGLPAASPTAYDEHRRINLWVGELTARSHETGRWRWIAGLFAARDEDTITSTVGAPNAITSSYREDRTDERLELAGFGEVTYRPWPALALTVGLRSVQSQISVDSLVRQPSTASAGRAYSGRIAYSGASPKVALAYQYSPQILFYAQVAEGYRPGGFNTGGPAGQAFNASSPGSIQRIFSWDSAWTIEGGMKASLFRHRLTLHIGGYETLWSNIQTDQFSSYRLPYTVNVGDGQIQGLEVEAALRFGERWTARLGGIIASPQLTRELNPNFQSKGDAGLPGVPAQSYNAALSYRRDLGSRIAFTAESRFAYVGRSNLTFDAQTQAGMGGYFTGRLSAGLERGRWRLAAYLDNPGDVRANTFAFGNPFSFPQARQSTPLRPRTFGLSLGADF